MLFLAETTRPLRPLFLGDHETAGTTVMVGKGAEPLNERTDKRTNEIRINGIEKVEKGVSGTARESRAGRANRRNALCRMNRERSRNIRVYLAARPVGGRTRSLSLVETAAESQP